MIHCWISVLDKQLQLLVEIHLVHPHMQSGYPQLRGSLVHSGWRARTWHFHFDQHTYQERPFSVHINAKSNVDCTFYNSSFTSDMIVDSIHKYDSVHFFQRTFLPSFTIGRILSVIRLMVLSEYQYHTVPHVRFDISGSHSLCIHGKDFSSMS